MMGDELSELIVLFKAQEDRFLTGAVQLIGDKEAQRVAVAWGTLPVEWKEPKRKRPKLDNERDLWDWAWEGAKYDGNELAERAGVDRFDIAGIFKRLVAAHMVYPDGTLSGIANGVLRTEVIRATRLPIPKRPKEKDEGKKEEPAEQVKENADASAGAGAGKK